jgi:hypothetical protein
MAEKKEEEVKALAADFGIVYVKIHKGSLMKPVKSIINLYDSRGHTYNMKGKNYITGPGYKILNKVASISIVTPKTVIVDGKEEPNPYVERNTNTKAIETVSCRKIGIGFSPLGNITVVDKTVHYNVYTYLIQALQSKMKKDDRKDKCAFIGIQDDKPTKGKWVFFETASPLGIWANYEDKKIIEVMEEHTQRQRFGDRISQSICERNILRDHPAIGIAQVEPDSKGISRITVYGWRHDLGTQQVGEVMEQAEAGAEEIEVKKEVVEVAPEEEKEAIQEETAADPETKEKPLFGEEEK